MSARSAGYMACVWIMAKALPLRSQKLTGEASERKIAKCIQILKILARHPLWKAMCHNDSDEECIVPTAQGY